MQPYAGYLQLVPRLIADAVALLPLRAAAAGFAVAGALVAAACGVFVCQASAGHIRMPALRWLLAAGVILLPSALTELSGNGVNTPWYLLFGLFWALLWRPRSGPGAGLAVAVAFAAASSNALAAVFAPLVLARVIALPRAREHAVTLGWVAGGALQLVAVLRSAVPRQAGHASAGLSFYLHSVLVTAVAGRHFASLLATQAGPVAGTLIPAAVAAMVTGWAVITGGPRVRLFAATALGLGLALVLVAAIARGWGIPAWTGCRSGVIATRPRRSCSSTHSPQSPSMPTCGAQGTAGCGSGRGWPSPRWPPCSARCGRRISVTSASAASIRPGRIWSLASSSAVRGRPRRRPGSACHRCTGSGCHRCCRARW